MSENIVSKIRKAEEEAQKLLDQTTHKLQSKIVQARKDLESDRQKFESESRKQLKNFRQTQNEKYKAETKHLRDEGEKARDAYAKELESRFGEIKGKIEEMIRKELCL